MVAGFGVAHLGQMRQRLDAGAPRQVVLGHAPRDFGLKPRVLVFHQHARLLCLQLGLHPCQHHHRLDRFGDVVAGTQAQAALLLVGIGQRREKDHRNGARERVGAQLIEHVVAVHARHHDVEQNQVGSGCLSGDAQCGDARARGQDPVQGAQQLAEQVQVLGRVVDDQQRGARVGIHGRPEKPSISREI